MFGVLVCLRSCDKIIILKGANHCALKRFMKEEEELSSQRSLGKELEWNN